MEKLSISESTLRFLFDSLLSRYVMLMTAGNYAELARRLGAPEEITCDLDANPSIVDPEAKWYVTYTEFIGFWRRFYSIPDAKERAEIEAGIEDMRARRASLAGNRVKAKARKKGKG